MISVFERMDAAMLKYGIYAKAVELLCFQPALEKLSAVYPEMDIKSYKKNVKHEYKNMLLRTPDIGGSISQHLSFLCTKQNRTRSRLRLWMQW